VKNKYKDIVYGVVSLDEWGWKEWHRALRKANRKKPIVYLDRVDFGKLIGILQRLESLEEKELCKK
jgi:hypothetical protein